MRMPRKRSKKGYAQVASDDLDDVAAQYGAADHIPVPKALHEFDPKVQLTRPLAVVAGEP